MNDERGTRDEESYLPEDSEARLSGSANNLSECHA